MAQDYITLEPTNEIGKVKLNKSVFASIVANVIDESEKVILDDSRTFKNAIVTHIENNQLSILAAVKVNHKANVADVCAELQNKIFESISYMTELKCESIEIQVTGFIF